MEEKNKICISLKTFILTIITMSLIILALIFVIFTKNNQKESNIINTKEEANISITNTSNLENKESENSKPEINHGSGKFYEPEENTIVENNKKETDNELNNTKNNIKTNNNKQVEDKKIFTTYTKDFIVSSNYIDTLEYGENGQFFGWEEAFFDGCSTWCSVSEFAIDTKASSTLKPHGQYTYSSANTQNNNRENAWVEGVEGDGIGEYIEIEQTCIVGSLEYETDIGFEELCIVNGYAATEKNWIENNRVKELKMYFNGDYAATIVLEDIIKQQYIDISDLNLKVKNGETAKFKFEIGDVYKGTKYDDTCITGLSIEFSGRTPH